ncbi:Protein tyrosine kinase [Rhizoctonia solani]|uniref:Protein tyrosine kinase n=1 Tax=Rhizoctonia solani TaxID=456999 RepID=A0A8H7HF36_9AGAM|nr:Protein tyrosine kinase [Rhizoctonia solani]
MPSSGGFNGPRRPWVPSIAEVFSSSMYCAGAHERAASMVSDSNIQSTTRMGHPNLTSSVPTSSRNDAPIADQTVLAVTCDKLTYTNVTINRDTADAQTIRQTIASKITSNPSLKFDIYRIASSNAPLGCPLDDDQLLLTCLQEGQGVPHFFADLSMIPPHLVVHSNSHRVSHSRVLSSPASLSTIVPATLLMPEPCVQRASDTSSVTRSGSSLPSDSATRHDPIPSRSTHHCQDLITDPCGNIAIPEPAQISPITQPFERQTRRYPVPYWDESPPIIASPGSDHAVSSLLGPRTPQPGQTHMVHGTLYSEPGRMSEAEVTRQNSGYSEGANSRMDAGSYQSQAFMEGPSLHGGCNRTISRRMTVDEVLHELHSHGCKSMSPYVNRSMSGDNPVAYGGFGDIYRGVLNNGAEVSLKCVRLEVDLDDGGQRKIKDAAHELYIWSKCKHPNVLELMGVTQHRGHLAMVSPWMENGDLTRFLAQHPYIDRYNLCAQIADGVAYLHQENVVHGDIKGVNTFVNFVWSIFTLFAYQANILVSKDLTPKITDFGTASRIDCTLKFTETSRSQTVSVRWTAPEVMAETIDKSTPEADVFSLGMTILEVFTGNVPFPGVSTPAVILKLVTGGHPARPEEHIPTGDDRADLLWSLLSDCWAFKPEDRPTADDVKYRMRIIGST